METTEIELEAEVKTRSDRQISVGVNRVLDSALEAFISTLDQHTLADLAGSDASQRPTTREAGRRRKRGPAVLSRASVVRTSPRRAQ
jgi:DNA-binding IscR family transcriptional regulator